MDDSGRKTKDALNGAPAGDPQTLTYTSSATRSEHSSVDSLQILRDLSHEASAESLSTQVSPGPLWAHTRATLASTPVPPAGSSATANLNNSLSTASAATISGLTSTTSPNNQEAGIPHAGPPPQLRFHPLSWAHHTHGQSLEPSNSTDELSMSHSLGPNTPIPSLAPSEGGIGSSVIGAVPPSLLPVPSLHHLGFPTSMDPTLQSVGLFHPAFLPHLASLEALSSSASMLGNPGLSLSPNSSDSTPRTTAPLSPHVDASQARKGLDPLRFGLSHLPLPDAALSLPALMNPYALALYYQSSLPLLAASQVALPTPIRPGATFPLASPFLPSSPVLGGASTRNMSSDHERSISMAQSMVPNHRAQQESSFSETATKAPLGGRHARQSSSRLEFGSSHSRNRSSPTSSSPSSSKNYSSANQAPRSVVPSGTVTNADLVPPLTPLRSLSSSKGIDISSNESFVYRNKGSTVSFSDLLETAKRSPASKAAAEHESRGATMHTSSHATRISSLADEGLVWEASLCDTSGHLPPNALTHPSAEDWFHSWQLNRRVAAKWLTGANADILQLLFDISKFYACNFEGYFLDFIAPDVPSQAVLNEFMRLIKDHIATNMESDSRLVHVATSYFNCSSRKRAAPECGAKLNTQLWFDAAHMEFFESIEGAKKSNSKNLHSAACRACHKSRLPPSVSTLRVVDRLLSLGHPPAVVEEMIRNQAIAKTGGFADDGRLLATTGTIFNRQRKVRTEQSKQMTSPHPSRRKALSSSPPSRLTSMPTTPPSPPSDSSETARTSSSSMVGFNGRSKTRSSSTRPTSSQMRDEPSSLQSYRTMDPLTRNDDASEHPGFDEEEEVLLTLSHLRRSPTASPIGSPSRLSDASPVGTPHPSSDNSHSPRLDEANLGPNAEPNPKKRQKDFHNTSDSSKKKRVRLV